MNKAVKVVLNVLCGAGIGVAGYQLGKMKYKKWVESEINDIITHYEADIKRKEEENEAIKERTSAKPVNTAVLTPDILEKLEKNDEVEVPFEPETTETVVLPITPLAKKADEPEKEAPKPKKSTRRAPRKTPYLIECERYDAESNDHTAYELSLDIHGDLYYHGTDDLFVEYELVGEKLVARMLKDLEEGIEEWWVFNEAQDTMFDITYRSH